MRTVPALLAALLLPLAACERSEPRLICHNGNCTEPTDPESDDTLSALRASLALVDDEDRPIIDGVELDLFWDGALNRCIYAHDLDALDGANDPPAPADAVAVLSEHLLTRADSAAPITHDGGAFVVFLEMKPHVGKSKSDKHTAAQRVEHATCVLQTVQGLVDVSSQTGTDLRIIVSSFDPALLRAVASDQGFVRTPTPRATVELCALQGVPPPLDSQTVPIEEFADVPLDVISVHPQWARSGQVLALESRRVEVAYWMFQAVPETLAAIASDRPDLVVSSEANLLRRWIDDQL